MSGYALDASWSSVREKLPSIVISGIWYVILS